MYLNNSLIDQGICNDTIGVITDVNPSYELPSQLEDLLSILTFINKQTHYFEINGTNCHQTQFPLQNCFDKPMSPLADAHFQQC